MVVLAGYQQMASAELLAQTQALYWLRRKRGAPAAAAGSVSDYFNQLRLTKLVYKSALEAFVTTKPLHEGQIGVHISANHGECSRKQVCSCKDYEFRCKDQIAGSAAQKIKFNRQ